MRKLVPLLGFVAIVAPARAGIPFALTGTWEGSISCKTEDPDGKGGFGANATVLINQLGATGPLVANVVSGGTLYLSGTIIPSADKPGEGAGAFIACGTSDGTAFEHYNEIETFHYKVDDDGSGSLKVNGVNVTNGVETDVCKGSFKRTSFGSPKTVACDAL